MGRRVKAAPRATEQHPLPRMLEPSAIFILLTFAVFVASIRDRVISRPPSPSAEDAGYLARAASRTSAMVPVK
jgi:hypothetical protein